MTLWRAIHESERYLLGHLNVHADIDRCLELLDDHDLSSERRSAISTALIDEINRLSLRLEQRVHRKQGGGVSGAVETIAKLAQLLSKRRACSGADRSDD
jgi:hypothetical protein